MEEEIIYFEVDNWIAGKDFPDCEPFLSWMSNDFKLMLGNVDFVRENKICVCEAPIDMSVDFLVTAPKSWVEKNCPCILEEKYKKFLSNGRSTRYGYGYFLPYEEEYIGKIEYDESYWGDVEEDNDDEDSD